MNARSFQLIGTLFVSILLTNARAEARDWSGTQVMMPVSGEMPIDGTDFGVRAHAAKFVNLSKGANLTFFYAGPTWTLRGKDLTLWVSPQFVGAFGFWKDHDAFGSSVWTSLNYKGKASIFLEGERYFSSGGRAAWYAFYSANVMPIKWINLGFQGEQIDVALHAGPHVGFTKGPFHAEIQYHWGLTGSDVTNAIRLVTGLSF